MLKIGFCSPLSYCDTVFTYINDLGNIKSYEFVDWRYLKVHTDSSTFYCFNGRSTSLARVHSSMRLLLSSNLWISNSGPYDCKGEISAEERKLILETHLKDIYKWDERKQENVLLHPSGPSEVIDPRVIRTEILGIWMLTRLEKKVNEEEKLLKEINKFINEDLDWTIDEAAEWMKANDFTPLQVYRQIKNTNWNYEWPLPNPYWKPERKYID